MNKSRQINIAFCFDEKMMRQACVTISSLLEHKSRETSFHVFCVCSPKALRIHHYLKKLIMKYAPDTTLTMCENTMDLKGGYEIRGITVSTYFRLNLHNLFPHIDKMIYSDVDILFHGDISEIWNMDMENYYLAGVRADVNIREAWMERMKDDYWKELSDWYGNYINAGFILMNLKKIRESGIGEIWKSMVGRKYYFQDQDILNITCKPHIAFLPMEYNRMMFYTEEDFGELRRNRIVTRQELEQAINDPKVIHYAGEKPWNKYKVAGADNWWSYVKEDKDLVYIFRKEIFRHNIWSLFPGRYRDGGVSKGKGDKCSCRKSK